MLGDDNNKLTKGLLSAHYCGTKQDDTSDKHVTSEAREAVLRTYSTCYKAASLAISPYASTLH